MTSIGRGRGWARSTESESVLRRPGQPSSPKSSELDEFIDRICNDFEIDDGSPVDKLRDFGTLVENLGNNQSAEELVEKIWPLALEDRCFGMKLMKLVFLYRVTRKLKNKSIFISNINGSLLQKTQATYEKREELRKENPSHLTNLVWILGATVESYGHPEVVVHTGQALINCCSLLLDTATEDDTEAVAIQIYLNSKSITAALTSADKDLIPADATGLNEIVNKARTNLVNRNVSTRTRALLLLIIDFANQRYEPLTGDLQAFYASVLGSSRAQENDSQFRIGRDRPFNSEAHFYGILTRGMRLAKNENKAVIAITHESTRNELPPPPQVQKKNRGPNGGCSAPLPRAIRGSGASETPKEPKNDKRSPRGHKEKLTDEQVWSAKQNTGSKVWGHDDRFDNDYESK